MSLKNFMSFEGQDNRHSCLGNRHFRLVRESMSLLSLLVLLGGLTACGGDSSSGSSADDISSDSRSSGSGSPLNSTIEYGKMTDKRDGQVYKTVVIGSQTWMAENLNYETDNSYCYDNKAGKCAEYGRYYTWASAVGKTEDECGSGKFCNLGADVQGVCPDGWHLPTKVEWNILLDETGDHSACKRLRSQSGWDNENGTDDYGFSALPAGFRRYRGDFDYNGYSTYFWSAAEDGKDDAYIVDLSGENDFVTIQPWDKGVWVSVRCIQDGSGLPDNSIDEMKKMRLNPDITYGTMTDERDGKAYKTIKIGKQEWMAENLDYADSVKTPSLLKRSWCYDNDVTNCAVAGRLYSWSAAIDSISLYDNGLDCGYDKLCELPAKVQGICPDGWHLPDTTEWNTLIDEAGGRSDAGAILKSQTGWSTYYVVSSDALGFSANPDGSWNYVYDHFNTGTVAFWSSTEERDGFFDIDAFAMFLDNGRAASLNDMYKLDGVSVRCIKDSEDASGSGNMARSSSSRIDDPDLSSSSSSESKTAWDYLNPEIDYGEMVDERDGQVYKTVTIGSQTWMAQNLNYETDGSFCLDDDTTKCSEYGRLYTWADAVDSIALYEGDDGVVCYELTETCNFPAKIRGVCPNGWHLPNYDEWKTLFDEVGGQRGAGKVLKSQMGWDYSWDDANGTDAYGFSVHPAGSKDPEGEYGEWRKMAYFWYAQSSAVAGDHYGSCWGVYDINDYFDNLSCNKKYSLSVRCLKD